MAGFSLMDVFNMVYISLQEPMPTSATDQTSSRITLPNVLNILTYVIRRLNAVSGFIQHSIIPVTAGIRQYALPAEFIEEYSVKYRGIVLKKAPSIEATMLVATIEFIPYQYTIIWPGTEASALPPTGQPYIILDPAPSETSAALEPNPPMFPSFEDPYLVIFYQARIPTDFNVNNYLTYNFNLPPEVHPLFADLVVAKIMSLEGKTDIFTETFETAVSAIKEINALNQSMAETGPLQVQNWWWESP